jgi:ribosomal protein S18 acetylase RimI-like enzyme
VQITARKCVPGDESTLSLVGQATFLEAFAGVISGQNILAHCRKQHAADKYAAWLRGPASTVWLAEVEPDRAPVGYLVLTRPDLPVPDLGPADAEVKRIYLLHRFQGQGVGRLLMDAARAYAVTAGLKRLLLGVYSKNTTAITFYEKLGYEKIGRRSFHVGENTYEDFVFALKIAH